MSAPMMEMLEEYLRLRHGLGYRSPTQDRALRAFARHLDAHGVIPPILLDTSLDWAGATGSGDPRNPARRLGTLRGFLLYLSARDGGATQVPAPGLLGPVGARRPPHVYSDPEIGDLLAAAAQLSPQNGLRPLCYVTLFALLACTGMRISEALALSCADVDMEEGMIVVRAGKRGRARLVPLHPSALAPLREYRAKRIEWHGPPAPEDAFFRTEHSEPIPYNTAHATFCALRDRLGWTGQGRSRPPRIHDLRHHMVIARIQAWYAEGADVDAMMPVLATYLGHAEVRDTYWYLSAVPELTGIVADRFESFAAPAERQSGAER